MKSQFHLFILFSLILFVACDKELRFEKIEHETIYRKLRPNNTSKFLSESWIVYNFVDNKENEARIDSFVCTYVDTISRLYGNLHLAFYKHSRITNIENLTRRHDNISESMATDYLWEYAFDSAGFSRKVKLKNFENRKFFFPEPPCLLNKK